MNEFKCGNCGAIRHEVDNVVAVQCMECDSLECYGPLNSNKAPVANVLCNDGLESLAQKHKQAYDEILKHLQDAEMAARNKQYITARTCAMNAVDCSAKWHKAF